MTNIRRHHTPKATVFMTAVCSQRGKYLIYRMLGINPQIKKCKNLMLHYDLRDLPSFRIKNVDRAGHAGVKGVNGAQDFEGPGRIGYRGIEEGFLEDTSLPLAIPG